MKKIKSCAKNCEEIILATDPDREGEAIAWHVADILTSGKNTLPNNQKISRAVFYEISKEAVNNAVSSPSEIAMDLVLSQETRRALDRHFGFTLSPLLWRLFPSNNHSAGRVQSPALRMIVERERESKCKRERRCERKRNRERCKSGGSGATLREDKGRR